MKISELIEELEEFKNGNGDVDIYIENMSDREHFEPLQIVQWKGIGSYVAGVIQLC